MTKVHVKKKLIYMIKNMLTQCQMWYIMFITDTVSE